MRKITINSNLNTVGGDLDELRPEIMRPEVFKLLRKCGWRAVPWKRYVVLSFDIVSLKVLNPSLTPIELQHLPPFMLFFTMQIVNTKTFQPVGKVFLKQSTPPDLVASCIMSFIRDLMRCEYAVVATVCRPIYFFQRVLQHLVQVDSLKQKIGPYMYKVEHLKIVHLFDPINMLENTFILFLKYAMKFTKNKTNLLATYDDCKTVMIQSTERDTINYIFNNTNNITCAVRLFSKTFYREIQGCISKGKLTNIGSAEFCVFFDVLFDSLHGNMEDNGLKVNRGPISKISPHYKIWNKSLDILNSLRIVDKSGANIRIKNNKEDAYDFKINDDYEYYEILHSISQAETENSAEIENSMNQVLEKIKEIKLEDEKHSLPQQNLETIEVKYYNNTDFAESTTKSICVEKEDDEYTNFKDENDFCLTIKNSDLNTELEENNSDCITLTSEDISADTLKNYLKKLYVTLRNSECADVKISGNMNGVAYRDDDNEYFTLSSKDDVLDKQCTERFSTQHFDKNLNYLQYFVNNDCMPKKNKYIEIEITNEYNMNGDQNKSNNLNEKIEFNEDDYFDESEIVYSKEAIISDDSYKEHEDIEYHISNADYETNEKHINETIINKNYISQDVSNIKDFEDTNKHSKRSTLNRTIVENILIALVYVRTRLESHQDSEQILKDIVNYLKTCDVVGSNVKLQEKREGYIHIINESLANMMIVLSSNNPNDSEKDIACINLTIISQHLKELKKDNANLNKGKNGNTSVSDIPNFFGSKHCNKNEMKPNPGNVYKNLGNTTAKILPNHSVTTNKGIQIEDKSDRTNSQIFNDKKLNVENKQPHKHADLAKIHADIKKTYPEIDIIHPKINNECKIKINSENNSSSDKIDESDHADNSSPYVFDAWQITINGAKKLFELLQKKRFQQLHMDTFNIDYIRQIINDVRKDQGEDIGNDYHAKMILMEPPAAPYVFDTVGTLILE